MIRTLFFNVVVKMTTVEAELLSPVCQPCEGGTDNDIENEDAGNSDSELDEINLHTLNHSMFRTLHFSRIALELSFRAF